MKGTPEFQLGRRPDEVGDSARRLAKQLDEPNEPVDQREALFYRLASPDNEPKNSLVAAAHL